VFVDTHND